MTSGRKSRRDDGTAPLAGDEPAAAGSAPRSIGSGKPAKSRSSGKPSKRGYLDGQMLIAMPTMGDERFARSVIYVCAHSTEGAMGIIVNQPAANISFSDLLVQFVGIPGRGPHPASFRRRRREGAQGRAGGYAARLRIAFERFRHRELDPADRRRHLS